MMYSYSNLFFVLNKNSYFKLNSDFYTLPELDNYAKYLRSNYSSGPSVKQLADDIFKQTVALQVNQGAQQDPRDYTSSEKETRNKEKVGEEVLKYIEESKMGRNEENKVETTIN